VFGREGWYEEAQKAAQEDDVQYVEDPENVKLNAEVDEYKTEQERRRQLFRKHGFTVEDHQIIEDDDMRQLEEATEPNQQKQQQGDKPVLADDDGEKEGGGHEVMLVDNLPTYTREEYDTLMENGEAARDRDDGDDGNDGYGDSNMPTSGMSNAELDKILERMPEEQLQELSKQYLMGELKGIQKDNKEAEEESHDDFQNPEDELLQIGSSWRNASSPHSTKKAGEDEEGVADALAGQDDDAVETRNMFLRDDFKRKDEMALDALEGNENDGVWDDDRDNATATLKMSDLSMAKQFTSRIPLTTTTTINDTIAFPPNASSLSSNGTTEEMRKKLKAMMIRQKELAMDPYIPIRERYGAAKSMRLKKGEVVVSVCCTN